MKFLLTLFFGIFAFAPMKATNFTEVEQEQTQLTESLDFVEYQKTITNETINLHIDSNLFFDSFIDFSFYELLVQESFAPIRDKHNGKRLHSYHHQLYRAGHYNLCTTRPNFGNSKYIPNTEGVNQTIYGYESGGAKHKQGRQREYYLRGYMYATAIRISTQGQRDTHLTGAFEGTTGDNLHT